jgi:hypothetical protein
MTGAGDYAENSITPRSRERAAEFVFPIGKTTLAIRRIRKDSLNRVLAWHQLCRLKRRTWVQFRCDTLYQLAAVGNFESYIPCWDNHMLLERATSSNLGEEEVLVVFYCSARPNKANGFVVHLSQQPSNVDRKVLYIYVAPSRIHHIFSVYTLTIAA